MKTIELFSGTQSFSKVMRIHGHETFCIDNDKQFKNDWTGNILILSKISKKDILWASPPCQAFSVATIGRNWHKIQNGSIPKSEKAKLGLKLLDHTIKLIAKSKPKYWYIENPRGMMRKLIDKIFLKYEISPHPIRHTITYCQYGDDRMKPTDIWTNDKDWKPKQPCKNGMSCHISAPRGSRTGTQGLKNAKLRGIIPSEIFEEILITK